MPITVIAGRAGSGKSALLYQKLNKLGSDNTDAVLLVPEQFTLQAERELLKSSDKGYLSLNVMSISRLTKDIFSTIIAPDKKIIDARGKAAVMSQVALSLRDELKVFSKAVSFSGFSSEVAELIGQLKKYDITPDSIDDAIPNEPTRNTNKISDISKIYKAFNDYLGEKDYIDSNDRVNYLIDILPKAKQYKDTHFFFDGFDRLTNQDLRIIEALLKLSGNITICANTGKDSTEGIFLAGKKAIEDLKDIADRNNTEFEVIYPQSPHVNKHPSIVHLEKNIFADNPKQYKGDCAIDLYYANDILQEAEHAACYIRNIIKKSDYTVKYGDICVLCCGNLTDYGPLLERIFTRYEIPCFTHQRKAMAQHPAVGYLLSALSAKVSNTQRSDVISMLKSGYSGIDYELAIQFEDYILDNGIDGYLFTKKLMRGAKRYDIVKMNEVRDKLLSPLDSLVDAKLPATIHLKGIFNMLSSVQMKKRLLDEHDLLLENDMPKYAAQTAQTWNTIIEILEQLNTLFGETEMTLEQVQFALEESFITTQIGLIPLSSDEVLIGELGRTKLSETKYLLVLGANEGRLPALGSQNPIFNDNDLDYLMDIGIDFMASSLTKRSDNDYSIYQALSTPSMGLCLSYPLSGSTDTRLPSEIVTQLEDMYDIMSEPAQIDYMISEAAALSVTAQAFGAIGDGRIAPSGWERAVSALLNKGENATSFNKMRMFASMPISTCDIAPRKGDTIVSSISQLEQYAGCPFSYMVKYALRPKDDPGEEITPAGEGAFLHEAMQRLGDKLQDYDINSMEDDTIKDIMEKEAGIIAQNFDAQRLSRDGKGKYQAKQLTKTAKHSAIVYAQHLKNSTFRPIGQEIEFGEGKELPPIELSLDSGTKVIIKGKVDRLDTCQTPTGKLARIIDYKSSTKKIEYKNIVAGRQLQLFIYMDAYLSVNDDIKASGVFYFPVKNNYIDQGKKRVDEDRMQGLFIDESENITALDKDIDELGKSSLIKASYKKDGSFNKTSDNINKEGFYKILSHSKKVATDMLNGIDRGDIPVSPLKINNESVCKYCEYSAICRKDVNLLDEKCELDNDTALQILLGGDIDG